jgi:hypothetical protein
MSKQQQQLIINLKDYRKRLKELQDDKDKLDRSIKIVIKHICDIRRIAYQKHLDIEGK